MFRSLNGGFLSVFFAYRASILVWSTGIISCVAYVFFNFHLMLYASMYLQFFYIITCAFGWYEWNKKLPEDENKIKSVPIQHLYFYVPFVLISWLVVGWFFDTHSENPKPYTDALATVLSVTAKWFLIKRYIQNWFVWVLADNIYCYVYMDETPTLIMYLGYLFFAVLGYFQWKKIQQTTLSE